MRWKFLLTMDLLNVFAFAFWGPLFTLYAVHLGAKPSLAAVLYAFYIAVHAFANLFFGHVVKPKQRVFYISIGFFIQALCAIIFTLVDGPLWLCVPLAISAVAGGMIAPNWKALYTRAMRIGHEGKSWSWYDSGEAGVLALGTAFAGLMISYFGYKSIFIPLGILDLLAAILSVQLNVNSSAEKLV